MSKKFYSFILLLYPGSHRARFGAEMLQVFHDAHRDAAAQGALFGFWVRIISDAVVSATAERATALQGSYSRLYMNKTFLKPTVGKVVLAAIPLVPLYWILVLAFMGLSLALPHPHTDGLGAAFALTLIALVPALVSAAISYLCACGLVALFTDPKTA